MCTDHQIRHLLHLFDHSASKAFDSRNDFEYESQRTCVEFQRGSFRGRGWGLVAALMRDLWLMVSRQVLTPFSLEVS